MYGSIQEPHPFSYNKLFSMLLSRGLKPLEIRELTLTEAMLYTLLNEDKKGSDDPKMAKHAIKMAEQKFYAMKELGLQEKITLNRLIAEAD